MATRRGFRPPGDGEAVAPGAMSSRGAARWRDRGTGRAAGEDLHDPGGEAHQHAELPGAVVGAGPVENQATAKGAQRGADLVHHKGDAEQGRHVAGAEHLGDEAADQGRHAEPQHSHRRCEDQRRGRGRRHHEISGEDEGAQDVEEAQQDVLRVASAEPAGGERTDTVHATDHRQRLGAQHRVLAADRQIRREVRRQEHEVEAADEIGCRHHYERPVARGLPKHLAHARARAAAHRHVVGAAGGEPGRQHRYRQPQKEQRANLPGPIGEQGLRR